MAKATRHGEAKPAVKHGSGPEAETTKADTPAADKANSQDKQKDKPDSGANEDG